MTQKTSSKLAELCERCKLSEQNFPTHRDSCFKVCLNSPSMKISLNVFCHLKKLVFSPGGPDDMYKLANKIHIHLASAQALAIFVATEESRKRKNKTKAVRKTFRSNRFSSHSQPPLSGKHHREFFLAKECERVRA